MESKMQVGKFPDMTNELISLLNDKIIARYLKEVKKLSYSEIAKALKLSNSTSSVQSLLK